MSDPRIQKLVDECHRQEENCRYTAVSFTLWLRWLKRFRLFCEVAPIVFGALATWKIVSQTSPTWAAVFTLLATVIPPVYKASKADRAIDDYTTATGNSPTYGTVSVRSRPSRPMRISPSSKPR